MFLFFIFYLICFKVSGESDNVPGNSVWTEQFEYYILLD